MGPWLLISPLLLDMRKFGQLTLSMGVWGVQIQRLREGDTAAESAIQRKDGENSRNKGSGDGVHEEVQES